MSEPVPAPATAEEQPVTAPVTGDTAIDGALAQLADLQTAPLPDHHDRLTAAHEVLHGALDRSDPGHEPR